MPAFNVMSSIDIDAPTSRVREIVSDFTTWPTWSPWLIMEPDCTLSYKGIPAELGHGYDWEGDKVGAGGMVMTNLDANRMESDLQFLKPWKSQADIAFDFEAVGENKTHVKWHMDSSLPFFMFFMVNKMKAMIGSDYDRGLRMLKDYIESGSIESSTTIDGMVDVPSALYAGKSFSSSMENIGDSMAKAFPEVYSAVTEKGVEPAGMPFSIYNKMDMANQSCDYTAAIPLAARIDTANGIECNERPACKALKLTHVGPYHHLGNAWATGMQDIQHHKHKMDKKIPAFEIYLDDPENTPEAELRTEVYIPVKS